MKARFAALLASLVIFLGFTAPGLRAEDAPQALVSELYQSEKNGKSPFGVKASRARLGHYFTKELAALIWKDGEESRRKNEVGVLDFDPLYGAQDMEIKALSVNKSVTTKGRTSVTVSFTNFGKKRTTRFDFVQEDGAWKISDIHYADGSSLLKLFKDAGAKR